MVPASSQLGNPTLPAESVACLGEEKSIHLACAVWLPKQELGNEGKAGVRGPFPNGPRVTLDQVRGALAVQTPENSLTKRSQKR